MPENFQSIHKIDEKKRKPIIDLDFACPMRGCYHRSIIRETMINHIVLVHLTPQNVYKFAEYLLATSKTKISCDIHAEVF